MPSYKKMKQLNEGDIQIYIQSSSKTNLWQVRFKNPLPTGGHYVRKSTGYRSEAEAIRFALDLYREYYARTHLGLATGKISMGEAVERFKDQYDPVGKKNLEVKYKSYWQSFFGSQDMAKMGSDLITGYFKWRIKNAKSHKSQKCWDASGGASVALETLRMEEQLMRRLFRFCKDHRLIHSVPSFPKRMDTWSGVHSLPSAQSRGRIDYDEDYLKVLLPYLNLIEKGIRDKDYAPILADPDSPFNEKTNRYIGGGNVGRLRVRRGKSTHKIWTNKRLRYDHAFFWFFSSMIINCGIRPSELIRLRFGDISLRRDKKTGKFYTLVHISKSVSKIRKQRVAVCRDFNFSFERFLYWCGEVQSRFNRKIEDSTWLFPKNFGDREFVERKDKYNDTLRKHYKNIGLHQRVEKTTGVKVYFSSYSLRSFYITMRLRAGLDLYSLSKQVGSSPETIIKQYDVNEGWHLREKMVEHLENGKYEGKRMFGNEAKKILTKFATDWD